MKSEQFNKHYILDERKHMKESPTGKNFGVFPLESLKMAF